MPDGANEKPIKATELSSFLADLPSVIQKFWTAVAGPIFELCITLVVLFFALGGHEFKGALQVLPDQQFVETYGLKTLIPLAVLILLLGIAQGNSKLLRIIGAAMPGKLVPDRATLLIQQNPREASIEQAWVYNEKLQEIEELNTAVDEAIAKDPKDPTTDRLAAARNLQKKSELIVSTSDFVKGLFISTVAIGIGLNWLEGSQIRWGHLAIIFWGSFAALGYLALGRIRTEREYAHRKLDDYNYEMRMIGAPKVDPAIVKERLERVNSGRDPIPWSLNFRSLNMEGDLKMLSRALSPNAARGGNNLIRHPNL